MLRLSNSAFPNRLDAYVSRSEYLRGAAFQLAISMATGRTTFTTPQRTVDGQALRSQRPTLSRLVSMRPAQPFPNLDLVRITHAQPVQAS